jgi:hypothetical protein
MRRIDRAGQRSTSCYVVAFKCLEVIRAWSVTLATMKGPSHGELSLCSASVFWMRRRTRSPMMKVP